MPQFDATLTIEPPPVARRCRPASDILDGMAAAQLGRKIKPLEVGRVIAFLLSDDAIIIRGQSINVDGGDTPY